MTRIVTLDGQPNLILSVGATLRDAAETVLGCFPRKCAYSLGYALGEVARSVEAGLAEEDRELFRAGLSEALDEEDDVGVVATAATFAVQ